MADVAASGADNRHSCYMSACSNGVTVNSSTICNGQSATLTASNATTYVWSSGQTTSSITVSPAATTSFTVTGTTGTCSGTAISTDVFVGEAQDTKSFSTISKSGKIVNAYNALLLAEQLSKK